MSIIQSYDPEHYEEVCAGLSHRRLKKAIATAADDDYSLSQDLFSAACDNDKIRQLLNKCAKDRLSGRHQDCMDLGLLMTKFAADFYKNYAADNVEY